MVGGYTEELKKSGKNRGLARGLALGRDNTVLPFITPGAYERVSLRMSTTRMSTPKMSTPKM